jgi:D-methionine transport system substrate-binding protein
MIPLRRSLTSILAVALVFAFCGSAVAEAVRIRVGANPVPHGELLRLVVGVLADEGIDMEIVLYEDYEEPNEDLVNGELDANYFQNRLFLDGFNRDCGTDLVAVGAVHFERMGLYSSRALSLEEIPPGAVIVHPADNINRGRAFHFLEDAGLIRLSANASLEAGPLDVVDNPGKLRFQGAEAEEVLAYLDRSGAVVANCNFALEAGLQPSKDSLFEERVDPLFHNVVVVRPEDADRREIVDLLRALRSERVRNFIIETYSGAVTPAF